MTVSQVYLSGAHEPYAETLRKLLFDSWTPANTAGKTPRIISDFGVDGDPADLDAPLTSNDHKLRRYQFGIILREEDAEVTASDNQFVEEMTPVHIDVFGTAKLRVLGEREVSRIIFANQPRSDSRIPKSGGGDSGIVHFDRYMPDWRRVTDLGEAGIVPQSSAVLGVLSQRVRDP